MTDAGTGPEREGPILYTELASWWPLVSPPEEYQEEAAQYAALLHDHCARPARSLLELGSGGGNNASHLARVFDEVTLVDRAPGMLEVSRALNPGCAHHLGDMRTVRLGRSFDCVFAHDAISYATTLEDLTAVVETAFVHCAPGGSVLLAPDHVRERFAPGTDAGGHDGARRSVRYLEWTYDPDPDDTTYVVEYAFLLRDEDGTITMRHDRHVEGLFPIETWLDVLREAGFTAHAADFEAAAGPAGTVVFVGQRPAA